METYTIPNLLFKVEAHLHRASGLEERGTIFYLHGGGFIFGQLDDLPADMIARFNAQGYHVFAVNYPLAPEASLTLILKSVMMAYTWWSTHRQSVCGIAQSTTYLFGRSAGAYLAQAITRQLIEFHRTLPNGLILFYGYSHFDQVAFTNPSPQYLVYPRLSAQDVAPLRSSSIRTQARPTERLPLYIHARQQGTWLDLLGLTPESLAALDLRTFVAKFPPTFLAAAPQDEDVPYENALDYAQRHPQAHFYSAKGVHHDFDQRDKHQRAAVMDALLAWLSSQSDFEYFAQKKSDF